MTIEQIDRMVRGANPVPDLKALEPVDLSDLRVTQQRSWDMQTQDRIEMDQEPQRPKRGLLIGAAAVVLLLIGALVFFQSREEAPVVTQIPEDPAAVAIATDFVEAYGALDVDRAASYLAADADLSGLWACCQTWQLGAGFLEAVGFKVILESCEVGRLATSFTAVSCPFDFHLFRSDEIGRGPFSGSTFELIVRDGEIARASLKLETGSGFSSQLWEPFRDWVKEAHPLDVEVLYTDSSQGEEKITEASIPLWEQRTQEWVEVVRGG